MEKNTANSFFSIDTNFIRTDKALIYDIYINSSTIVDKKRFVRIFAIGTELSNNDITNYHSKYGTFYVKESQRTTYLESILERGMRYGISSDSPLEIARTATQVGIIKNFAIHHLNSLFELKKNFSTELLEQSVKDCHDTVKHLVAFVKDYSISQIQELIGHLSFHDFYTYDHSINVSMYCISMLKTHTPQISETELMLIGIGGLLHDLGKMKISNEILNKPGNLTPEEFSIIKTHPEEGVKILQGLKNFPENVDPTIIHDIILHHHENFDGSGYPHKLKTNDLHLYVKIATLADVFDALTTKRTYQSARTIDEALAIMDKSCKKKFDPQIFSILTKNIKKLVRVTIGHELADDFDPGIPYMEIPFKTNPNKELGAFEKNDQSWKKFGKAKVDDK